MALRITLDAFSGRPNPTVTIDGPEAEELLERVSPARRIAPKQAPEVPTSILGYRGLQFEQVGGKLRDELPASFRLAGGIVSGPKLRHAPADELVEDFIAGSTGPFRAAQQPPELLEGVQEQVHQLRAIDLTRFQIPIKWPVRATCRCAPLYEPDWWNDPSRQPYNNCYNYGTNYRTDTFAQPGLGTGQMYASIDCPEVLSGAVRDGLINNPNANNRCPDEGHLVALVIAPGPGFVDFHWFRKGRNGRWTHKPGGGAATNVDNSGNAITDPRNADRGPYTIFCTFMTVMHGHTKIR
jgi:hypothetical protein